jgi:hypothetical protein
LAINKLTFAGQRSRQITKRGGHSFSISPKKANFPGKTCIIFTQRFLVKTSTLRYEWTVPQMVSKE